MSIERLQIAGGSIAGTDHTKAVKNNHDAYSWSKNQDALVAVVCDGCGSGKHSEIGAKIGSRMIVKEVLQNIGLCQKDTKNVPNMTYLIERVRQNVIAQIRILTNAMGGSFSQTVNDYFLFTAVGVLITPDWLVSFSLGDGVIIINDEMTQIGPFENNAPPYLAYGIVESSVDPDLLKFQTHEIIKTEEIESVLIGTDGVIDLDNMPEKKIPGKEKIVGLISQFWKEDCYFKNPDMIRRTLSLINRDVTKYVRDNNSNITDIKKEKGLLPDDTTLIVIRHDPAYTEGRE